MKNEKIMIFGDSYSTFEGYIPEGYAVYYPRADVTDVSKTWWYMLAEETASEIVLNNSWSGSTICNTGYSGDCSKSSSFIFRLTKLIDEGFFSKNKIDRVLIFGATNDSWTGNTAGELIFDNWSEDDLKLVLPGISYFIKKLLEVVPKENICFIVNTGLREEISEGILKICDRYNVNYITLSDIEKIEGHPTYQGMISIKNQVISNLNRPCN